MLSLSFLTLMYVTTYLDGHLRCHVERKQALEDAQLTGVPVFVPVCHEDGQYAEVQCHYGTGYCWCVRGIDGKPIPGSSIRYTRPNCGEKRRYKGYYMQLLLNHYFKTQLHLKLTKLFAGS